jgi:hypothetical protein
MFDGSGTASGFRDFSAAMTKYRFVTPTRTGKWYPTLEQAQQFADKIGAGFFERLTRRFVPYKDTRLESADFSS